MKVAALSFTRRFNLENRGGQKYEHEEISVEVLPDDGETAEDLLAGTRAFIDAQRPGAPLTAPMSNGKPKNAPPLAPEAPKAAAEPLPFEPTKTPEPPKKSRKGRPPKAVTEARKAIKYALETTDIREFAQRINDARDKLPALPVDEWEAACHGWADHYRQQIPDESKKSNPEAVNAITNALKAERTAIDTRRASA